MLQLSLLSNPLLDLAGRLRFVAGLAPSSPTFLSPEVPVRFRLHRLLRVDVAVEVPIRLDRSATWGLELPVAAWLQLGSAFVGPLSGLFVNVPPYSLGTEHRGSILLGIGGGYAFSGVVDVKAQVLTPNVGTYNSKKVIGGGVGIGVAIP